jgi:putative ubiquitin-RnfH superfamily antitoxin RatB of RatAB toxin-antitoxin module
MQGDALVEVSVVYALAETQVLIDVTLPEGSTVGEAVARSGLLARFPEIASRPLACAIYSQPVQTSRRVEEGDRIEILRPLLIDPKENRRRTAARMRS